MEELVRKYEESAEKSLSNKGYSLLPNDLHPGSSIQQTGRQSLKAARKFLSLFFTTNKTIIKDIGSYLKTIQKQASNLNFLESYQADKYKDLMEKTHQSIKTFIECRYRGDIVDELKKLEVKLKEIVEKLPLPNSESKEDTFDPSTVLFDQDHTPHIAEVD